MVNLCKMGVHSYKQTQDNTYRNANDEKLGIQKQRARRVCRKCSKVQEMEVHCLGLNPPKYVRTWLNVKAKGGYLKATEARKIAEEKNDELKRVLVYVREATNKGETNCLLQNYDAEHSNSHVVRNLLKGLGYGMNKQGTGGPTTKDLIIYW